jgi:hypothetical protein
VGYWAIADLIEAAARINRGAVDAGHPIGAAAALTADKEYDELSHMTKSFD